MAAASQEGGFKGLMDTVIRKKLLRCCRWGDQSGDVFDAMAGDFMKPRIDL
jgi:serine carboxypeptidase 1